MPDFPDQLEEFLSESEYGCEVLDAVHGRWSEFFFGWETIPGQYRKRINAVQLFPCAMWIVLQLRYAQPDSFSSRAAGRLIDAIDHDAAPGHALIRLIPATRQSETVVAGRRSRRRHHPLAHRVPLYVVWARRAAGTGDVDAAARIAGHRYLCRTFRPDPARAGQRTGLGLAGCRARG